MPRDGLPPRARFIKDGTFAAVIRQYQRSSDFLKLAPGSQKGYSAILRLAEREDTLGALSVYAIRPALVQFFLDGLSDTPGKQKNAQAVLQAVEKFALVHDLLPGTITRGTYTVPSEGGHLPWSDSHVALAEAHARADLARIITLMVHTGQRGSDIVRMRWADIEDHDGTPGINVTTQKVGRRLWIPFSAQLRAALVTWERRPPFFLVLRPGGEPYTRELLSWHWNHERDNNALLEPLAKARTVLHGLRATCVVRLRHRRATTLEIASMIGMSLPMVERYSRFADQRDLAVAAIHHFDAGASGTLGERKPKNKTTGDG